MSDSEDEQTNQMEDSQRGEEGKETVDSAEQVIKEDTETVASFESLNLDARLQRAVAKLHFASPTLVQERTIPLILDGKDLLARAKTGSGKTLAYLLPILQAMLTTPATAIRALILVPTKELSEQIAKMLEKLTVYCAKLVKHLNIATSSSEAMQKSLLLERPCIVIATPARALLHLSSGTIQANELKFLVVDEADLVLSYGHEDDISALAKILPRGLQTIMMSATLDESVDKLSQQLCRKLVVLKLEEATGKADASMLQYYVKCAEEEKFLLTYVILKLKLIRGKLIIFVNEIDRCYRLKLFLEQFGIKSCVLNQELPINSRQHIVEQFNTGVYDIVIAADDAEVMGAKIESDDELKTENTSSRKRKRKSDKEYGVSRGVDFRNVACVLNFDLPTTTRSYVHRIGRTARAGKSGMAMSLVIPQDKFGKHKATMLATSKRDDKVLAKILEDQEERGNEVKPYAFNMAQVDAFRYRMEDALRSVTRSSIRDARAKELRAEIINSDKLKGYFEEHPEQLAELRHDAEVHAKRVQPHLKHVPEYLMPKAAGTAAGETGSLGFVGFRKQGPGNRIRNAAAARRGGRGRGGKAQGTKRPKKSDPLKTFK
jgi:ATP-dependent RNA helicase DDX56/DBP9